MHSTGPRAQPLIDERFLEEPHDVPLTVTAPAKAGPVNVADPTGLSTVEYGSVCYLYRGLNGATSVWTSPDGIDSEPRGQIAGRVDAEPGRVTAPPWVAPFRGRRPPLRS